MAWFRLVGTVVLLSWGTCLMAEPPTGSRLGNRLRDGYRLTEEEGAAAGQLMANCMVDHHVRQVQTYLLASTPAEQKASGFGKPAEEECFNLVMTLSMSDTRRVEFPADIMRGQLAQAELSRFQGAVAALPPLPMQKDYSRPWFAMTGRNAVVDEMATCVAERDPAGVGQLLRTSAYGAAEGAAMAKLAPNFGTCLRVGATLHANRQSLRAALAEALFQRVMAPAPGPVASAGR